MEQDNNTLNTAEMIQKNMSPRDFELYLYSLRKMAENNLESNRTFMTNLYNLRAFQYKAAEEMVENPDKHFAMIVLDFANFKSINEFCGRDAGDELLRCVADALREQLREHVVLSHFRADIFGMLTPFNKTEELIEIIQRIDSRISAHKILYRPLPAFGICIADSPTMSVSVMRDYATMALNSIKGKFYAKYAFFDEHMRQQMLMDKMIENNIVDALESNQIRLYVQPKINMATGKIIGGEALVRWQHPKRGLVPPAEFMPVLEKNGLVIDLDICIWTQVFQFIGKRLAEGKKVVPISINISRMHIHDNSFRKLLLNLAEEYHVPLEYVPLELTESGFLESEETMYEHMRYLKKHGFLLSMDDFGTGYSTLTMLKDQPVDEIKIDRAFITDIDNPKCQSVIRHTLNMLSDLNLKIIAEGVEEPKQQDFLLDCGCTNAQGFLYYKPIPVERFEALL
ncbi:MAG: putative bifunctional diguanylate cyclase/phosphodiesterase [Roseburia sp.]